MEFPEGTICHLLGGNGVGKSSFAKSIMGRLNYTGEVIIKGDICVIGSYTNIPNDLTIRDLIYFSEKYKFSQLFFELYTLLNIKDINSQLPLSKMSDGQKQKIKLLFFLSKNPKVIILDEFTASLDKKSMLDIYNFLLQYTKLKNILIINITHNLLDLEHLPGKYYYISNQKITLYKDNKSLIKDYTNLC
ncbi:MAG: ATP-binding cassette domain-containing protein [Sarcina ventriculi]